jgi:hypothetical protein
LSIVKSNQEKDQKPPEKHTITKKGVLQLTGHGRRQGMTLAARKMATHYEARTTVSKAPETDT